MTNSIDDFLKNPEPETPPKPNGKGWAKKEQKLFASGHYDKYQRKYIKFVLKNLKKESKLRKKEFKKLSFLAKLWTFTIILISILQGFGEFPFQLFTNKFTYLKFSLSSQAYIALVTTTTATILGLYTIAAYWLYRKDALTFDFLKNKDKDNSD
ncbi:hypothetical protein [Acinetobacter soli]|uniref:hypothetical protein n=1 Tax=Acinetobacter soli TaxID=487316 RepID=UPI000CE3CE7B|nr:hypothetical protein [Acinetobacter soli]PPB87198.1 hypothetical protein AsoHEU7_06445 [Acinetobacter soli]